MDQLLSEIFRTRDHFQGYLRRNKVTNAYKCLEGMLALLSVWVSIWCGVFTVCQVLVFSMTTNTTYQISSNEATPNRTKNQGPVGLTSSLMTNSLTVLAKVFSNTLIILLQKCE